MKNLFKREESCNDMKQWRWTVLVGGIIALTSQLYLNFFIDGFRISAAAVLYPVLLMTLTKNQDALKVGAATGAMVFAFRTLLDLAGIAPSQGGQRSILANGLFYVFYCLFFSIMVKNKYTVSFPRLVFSILVCDFSANICEVGLQINLNYDSLAPSFYLYLLGIAFLRTLAAGTILAGERNYRTLMKRTEHENRYQRLFLMTTRLKNEIYFMEKNTDEIESAMSNAYQLYEKLSALDTPPELKKMALSIARDVHEIKKDYIRIMQGIQKEIDEQNDKETMSLRDLLHILEESTHRMLESKRLDIQLEIQRQDNFVMKQHYALMVVLINLVNNAIEAIEGVRTKGWVRIEEKKEGDFYVFTVSDDGPGISERDMKRIFQMGFSTKFDELTGNIYRGVGLSGVKMTVEEKFHGTIEVNSQQGVGTQFQVRIPIHMLEET